MVLAFLVGCGEVQPADSAALMRGTDVAPPAVPDADAMATPDAGTTGAGGGAGAAGTGGAGAGGMTGAGGESAAGGAPGTGGAPAPSYTCDDLLRCCQSMPAGALRTQCLGAYSSATGGGLASCGTLLAMIKAGGSC